MICYFPPSPLYFFLSLLASSPPFWNFLVQGQVLTQRGPPSRADLELSLLLRRCLGGASGAPANSAFLLGVIALLADYELFRGEQNELLGCKWSNISYSTMWTLSIYHVSVPISKFHYMTADTEGFYCHRIEICDLMYCNLVDTSVMERNDICMLWM